MASSPSPSMPLAVRVSMADAAVQSERDKSWTGSGFGEEQPGCLCLAGRIGSQNILEGR